jgi:hypothetical protein
MFSNRQRVLVLVVMIVAVLLLVFLGTHHCPSSGLAFTAERRSFHRLKNRTTLPKETDFDSNVTLAAMLRPGADESRWSTTRAARIEGFVVSVGQAGVELANCYVRRDIHINMALSPDAPPNQQVVMEVTPWMKDWAQQRGWDWSAPQLKKELVGRWCAFEGWLLFDTNHAGESENIAPGRPGNWRGTAWEIHPITSLQILR